MRNNFIFKIVFFFIYKFEKFYVCFLASEDTFILNFMSSNKSFNTFIVKLQFSY
ncbi:hypothetical protein BVAVS116_H0040 (plasmid) [Borreliella valaisiana VS116]|uniref:Uncharacterized protein n=1 Tax=Borreliella valaisiana VS116 TaxID=445987 RepID=C0R997_BORVA|nr:hypothetical protein BVAVS116_H0040 [Borreliella valaisiana VS116]